MWSRHHGEWRDTAQVASQWQEAIKTDTRLLRSTTRGAWWETLATAGVTLLVTREYEHLVMAMGATEDGPVVSYMPMPHPSGLVADRDRGVIHIASTRNPNQVYDLVPATDLMPRLDMKENPWESRPLIPIRTRFYPGCLYMHDLALIGGALHANAVGQNAVVRLCDDSSYHPVWWPRCIDTAEAPMFGRNHLQLNSIAAGGDLRASFFSASTDKISARRPGHMNFPVNQRGVIFSGATREPVAWGLTRPHSARFHDDRIWVDNSGHGEFGYISNGAFTTVAQLPGWTRGLCFQERIAFVGTSRVIPRFRKYAPGVDVDSSLCGVHAVDTESGEILGSLIWPYGNQIFAIECVSSQFTSGFPFSAMQRGSTRQRKLFFAFKTDGGQELKE